MSDISLDEIVERPTADLREHFLMRGRLYGSAIAGINPPGLGGHISALIRNPAGSGRNMIIFELRCFLFLASSTTQLNTITAFLVRNPVVTATGPSQVITNQFVDQNGDLPEGQIFKEPTITGSGSVINGNAAINDHTNMPIWAIEPGEDAVLVIQLNDINNSSGVLVYWAEDDV